MRVLVTTLLVGCVAGVLAYGPGAAGPAGVALDIEFAVDGTGSMGPTIAQARRDAEAIMDGVRSLDTNARFAVVAFRDPGYPAPEYEVLQRLTGDVDALRAAIGRLRSVTTDDPGNVKSEAYNLVFQRSVTDATLGWRPASRKVVVVLGDSEPHGAGGLGIRGCRDTAPDTHGLKTTDVLTQMRNAGRTLVMVRQAGTDTALGCYESLAALGAPGGAARDGGSADLVTPILALVEGSLTPLTLQAGLPFALTGTSTTVRLAVGNRSGAPVTLESLALRLPRGTSFLSARAPLGAPTANGSLLTWTGPRTLPVGAVIAVTAKLALGSKAGSLRFVGTAKATSAAGRTANPTAIARLRVGRVLGIRLVASDPRFPVRGALSLLYPATARTLVGNTNARGTVRLGPHASEVTVRVAAARVLQAAANATVTLTGTVSGSAQASCRPGTAVTLRLVDRDFSTPRTASDLIDVRGPRCTVRGTGEVSAG